MSDYGLYSRLGKKLGRLFGKVGADRTINSQTVRVLDEDRDGDVLLASGTVVITDGGAGYAKGCLYIDTDGSAGAVLYLNEGTNTSCDFNAVATPSTTTLITKVTAVRLDGIANGGENVFLFVAPTACTITNVSLVSDVATTGSDGSNNYEFQVANLTQTQDLLSAVATTNGGEIAADTVFDVTPDQNATIAANDVIELQITENGTATDLTSAVVLAQIEYTVA